MNQKNVGLFKASWIVSTVFIGLSVFGVLMLGFGTFALALLGNTRSDAEGVIFMTITTFACIVPLAWQIPMTVHMKKIADGHGRNSIAFGVCSLIFCNIVSGILLLVGGVDD